MALGRLAGAVLLALIGWFAIVGQVTVAQTLVGVTVSGLVTALTEFDRRVADADVPRSPRSWSSLRGLPAAVVRDVVTVAAEAVRNAAGRRSEAGFVAVRVHDPDEGALVLTTLAATATPNTVVVGFDPEDGTLLIHQLRLSEDPAGDVHQRMP